MIFIDILPLYGYNNRWKIWIFRVVNPMAAGSANLKGRNMP